MMDIQRQLDALKRGDLDAAAPLLRAGRRRADAELLLEVLGVVEAIGGLGHARASLIELSRRLDSASLRRALIEQSPTSLLGVDIRDLLGRRFVYVPPGRFVMGSEELPREAFSGSGKLPHDSPYTYAEWWRDDPCHDVEISQGFLMQATPVTHAQWREEMEPASPRSVDARPIEGVNWEDAVAFCNRWSRKNDLPESFDVSEPLRGTARVKWHGLRHPGYRLPTEAEWEYAARAGTRTDHFLGDLTEPVGRDPLLSQIAWFDETSDAMTQPVGQLLANAWGLHDILGNVWEWCWDWYAAYLSTPQRDPLGPSEGRFRVIRGGSVECVAAACRSSSRWQRHPRDRSDGIGCRIVRSFDCAQQKKKG